MIDVFFAASRTRRYTKIKHQSQKSEATQYFLWCEALDEHHNPTQCSTQSVHQFGGGMYTDSLRLRRRRQLDYKVTYRCSSFYFVPWQSDAITALSKPNTRRPARPKAASNTLSLRVDI
jgi:hypothetical protein